MNYYEKALEIARQLKDLEKEKQLEWEKKYKELNEEKFKVYVELEGFLKDFDQKVLRTREVIKFERVPGTHELKLGIQGTINKWIARFEVTIDEKENKVIVRCKTWDNNNKLIEIKHDKVEPVVMKFCGFIAPLLMI